MQRIRKEGAGFVPSFYFIGSKFFIALTEHTLQDWTEAAIAELAYEDCFFVEAHVKSGPFFEIFIDSDEGVTFEKCRKISRIVEAQLDETPSVPEKYKLEVSSAGVGSPLKMKRQYVKNIGRTIAVDKADGTKSKGELIEVNEEAIAITYESVRKEGKKKIKETITEHIKFSDIMKSKIKARF